MFTAHPYQEPPPPTTSETLPQKGKRAPEIYRLRNFLGWFLNVVQVELEMGEIKMEQVQIRAMQMVD